MSSTVPQLSICVPSRNRQAYFQQTIMALTASLRTDVEFVFVDNSDDPTIMDVFMAERLSDPRIRYVPSGTTTRSMLDNWQAAMAAATGRWVSFIGDDDYADPDIAGLIARIEAARPGVEAIDWSKLFYTWPDGDSPPTAQFVALDDKIRDVPRQLLYERAFEWRDAKQVLMSGFSIYHGAVSRPLIDRITARYGGRFFEFPVVDYESIFKTIMNARAFVQVSRPLSVLGVSPLSNSAGLKNLREQERKQEAFDRELDTPVDQMACFADYPFKSRFGIVACIGMVHHWFAGRHGSRFSGFEVNFARSCEAQCNAITDRDDFDLVTARYRAAFATWRGGRFLKHFRPVFTPARAMIPFAGVAEDKLYVTADARYAPTCVDYYRLVSAALVRIDDLDAGDKVAAPAAERRRA
jgi:hypothetical protein